MAHLARVTQEPGVVRSVADSELLDLARAGILHSYEHTDEAEAALGGKHVATPARWKAPSGKEETVTASPAITDPAPADEKKG